jgi:spore coat polysaccharide biosynthesis predicted glycosyltransferase SpsG
MLWADVAIIAGGLTKYETAVTGTPSISISPFERELQMCLKFERAGSLLHLGLRDRVDEETITRAVEKLVNDYHLRQEISNRGKKMVDGKGTERIIAEIPANLLN